jgi:hypothetical protein
MTIAPDAPGTVTIKPWALFNRQNIKRRSTMVNVCVLSGKVITEPMLRYYYRDYNQLSAGTFPIRTKRMGRRLLWDRKDVDRYLDQLPTIN